MDNRNLDPMDSAMRNSVFAQIHEGMEIYDRNDNHIGKVDFVYFGASSKEQLDSGTGPAEPGEADTLDMRDNSLVDMLAEAFRPDEVPEVFRERLLLSGFIRMDAAGIFAADRYVTPDQIAAVSGDRVQLSVDRDDLIKRH